MSYIHDPGSRWLDVLMAVVHFEFRAHIAGPPKLLKEINSRCFFMRRSFPRAALPRWISNCTNAGFSDL
jgi:hypothetical protein